MSIKREQAIEIVTEYLSNAEIEMNNFGSALPGYVNPGINLIILSDKTEEHEFGWVFYYSSDKFIRTGDFRHALAGNAPLIVNRESGELIETGTAREISYYINNYIKTGDPHCET